VFSSDDEKKHKGSKKPTSTKQPTKQPVAAKKPTNTPTKPKQRPSVSAVDRTVKERPAEKKSIAEIMAGAPSAPVVQAAKPIVKKVKKPVGVDLGNLMSGAFSSLASTSAPLSLSQRYADVHIIPDEDAVQAELDFQARYAMSSVDLSGMHYGMTIFEGVVGEGERGEGAVERIGEGLKTGVEKYWAPC
jgi:hypothetical protein